MESQRGNVLFIILIVAALCTFPRHSFSEKINNNQINNIEHYVIYLRVGFELLTNGRGCRKVIFTPPSDLMDNDKTCHLFHTDGANVKYREFNYKSCPNGKALKDLNIGDSCADIIYIGKNEGKRTYIAKIDHVESKGKTILGPGIKWGPTVGYLTNAISTSNGKTNTDKILKHNSTDCSNYLAAQLCRALGSKWYLPAKDELNLLWKRSTKQGGNLDLDSIGINTSGLYYWSSSEDDANKAWVQKFNDGNQSSSYKGMGFSIRCFRRD